MMEHSKSTFKSHLGKLAREIQQLTYSANPNYEAIIENISKCQELSSLDTKIEKESIIIDTIMTSRAYCN